MFQCKSLIHGAALKTGYDAHTSPDKKELVIFNAHHILPSYIVHYEQVHQGKDFKYTGINLVNMEKVFRQNPLHY